MILQHEMIQGRINRFWATRVRTIAFDMAAHSIRVVVLEEEREVCLQFNQVSAFRYDSQLHNWSDEERFNWEIILLEEIHFIPELPITKQQLVDPHNIGYNFDLELYSTDLLIRAKHLLIDDELVF